MQLHFAGCLGSGSTSPLASGSSPLVTVADALRDSGLDSAGLELVSPSALHRIYRGRCAVDGIDEAAVSASNSPFYAFGNCTTRCSTPVRPQMCMQQRQRGTGDANRNRKLMTDGTQTNATRGMRVGKAAGPKKWHVSATRVAHAMPACVVTHGYGRPKLSTRTQPKADVQLHLKPHGCAFTSAAPLMASRPAMKGRCLHNVKESVPMFHPKKNSIGGCIMAVHDTRCRWQLFQ